MKLSQSTLRLVLVACVALALGNLAGEALASAIKNWSNGETLRPSDLNGNFNHIHNTMVGGHGARLVDADVSPSAAIAHSKLGEPGLIPRANGFVYSAIPCVGATSAVCTVPEFSHLTTVVGAGSTGLYTVTLDYTPTDSVFIVLVGALTSSAMNCHAYNTLPTAPNFAIECRNTAGALTDANFNFVVWDHD